MQIALGDLADPPSFRHALRGVRTVDPPRRRRSATSPRGTIEELNGLATWRLLAGGRARGRRALRVLLARSAPRRTTAPRFLRAKALAEQAVGDSAIAHDRRSRPRSSTRPGDRCLTLLERLALLPGRCRSRARPRAVPADLGRGRRRLRDGRARRRRRDAERARYELAGPRDAHPRGDRRGWRCAPAGAAGRSCTSRAGRRAAPARSARRWPGPPRSPPGTRPSCMEVPMTHRRAARPTPRRSASSRRPMAAVLGAG